MIPIIGKLAPDGAYTVKKNIAGFHHNGFRVVIDEKVMNMYGTDDEAEVIRMLDWMTEGITGATA